MLIMIGSTTTTKNLYRVRYGQWQALNLQTDPRKLDEPIFLFRVFIDICGTARSAINSNLNEKRLDWNEKKNTENNIKCRCCWFLFCVCVCDCVCNLSTDCLCFFFFFLLLFERKTVGYNFFRLNHYDVVSYYYYSFLFVLVVSISTVIRII